MPTLLKMPQDQMSLQSIQQKRIAIIQLTVSYGINPNPSLANNSGSGLKGLGTRNLKFAVNIYEYPPYVVAGSVKRNS